MPHAVPRLRPPMPYFLEDTTGALSGSDFNDMHGNMRLMLRRTKHDDVSTAYMIYDGCNVSRTACAEPSAVLDFPNDGSAGQISIHNREFLPTHRYLAAKTAGSALFVFAHT
jgi:hypothetical protein